MRKYLVSKIIYTLKCNGGGEPCGEMDVLNKWKTEV